MFFLYKFMSKALTEAYKCKQSGDIPVGCVIVKDGNIIARAHNTRERDKNPLGHAEINAIYNAAKHVGDWRLSGCDLYVTLEPCTMCAGAILSSRIENVFFGAFDKKEGAAGSHTNLLYPNVNVYGGIMIEECVRLLDTFFKHLRSN
ncbi:MAG TPA: nucleoside deaminase [Clostridiaceae bacterium]|nr:nucleoside deaminase [Clostridiaceae bacterium]